MKPTISDRLIHHEEEVRSNSCHLPVQIEDMKQAAHACLQRLPQQAAADLALWRVYKLGCLAKERSMRVQAEQQPLTLAGVLGCGQQPFSLGFHSGLLSMLPAVLLLLYFRQELVEGGELLMER